MSDLDRRLADAIRRGTLGAEARRILDSSGLPDDRERAEAAVAACRRIADETAREGRRLADLLTRAGVPVNPVAGPELAQRHEIRFEAGRDDVRRAVELLERDGYRRHPSWTGAAERSFWATSDEVALTRSAAWTTVVRLRWRAPRHDRRARLLRPRPPDWDAVRLPGPLWWAYPLVRLLRLAAERSGLRRRDHAALEPFLATPVSLIGPLLELADVGPDDVVADIGCGDGRLVVSAARATGCRAVGVEYSPDLVGQAREAVAREGLGDRVRIVQGEGRALDLGDVTVVLLFLPVPVAARLVPGLLARLPPGGRVVLHEQSALPAGLPAPAVSRPIVTDDAVTVAHLWRPDRDLGDASARTAS